MSNTYRDDREAAHALAEALQRENQELRAQLARARDGDFGSTFAPPPEWASQKTSHQSSQPVTEIYSHTRSLTVLMSALVLGFGALGTRVAMHPTHITVITPQSPALAYAPERFEVHTPSSGRFIARPPSASSEHPHGHDVFLAVQSARPAAESCFQARWEYSVATIDFSGDGSVSNVQLRPFNPRNGCIEAALRRMRLPSFKAPTWRTLQTFHAAWYRR